MNDLGRVNVFQASEQLIQEKFVVFFSQRLITFDNLSQIGVHHF